MILLEMTGGLGNQMFQYSLYRKLMNLGKEVYLDTTFYRSKQGLREFELNSLKVPYEELSDKHVNQLRGYGYQCSIMEKVAIKMHHHRLPSYYDKIDFFQPEIFDMDNIYLRGYWQNENYFVDIKNEIKKLLLVRPLMNKKKMNIEESIKEQDNTISIHVRRGDYLNQKNQNVYGGICTAEYYNKACEIIKQMIEKPLFVIFSDDIQWAKENIKEKNSIFVEPIVGEGSYVDLYLMSQCRHHIIANSSYSWWGAWLTEKEDTKVISPQRWLLNHEGVRIACDRWIQIDTN